jgi:hypothetical protein
MQSFSELWSQKLKPGRSISGAINYNEHKVRLGKAELILAQGYLKDPVESNV